VSSASHCDVRDGCDPLERYDPVGGSIISEVTEAVELVREYDKLGGREARLDETIEERLLSIESLVGVSDLMLTSDNGRRNDTVLALLSAGLPTLSSSSIGFLTSESLNSNFPSLSEAKYSSPRPKTTCKLAKSRVVPSVGYNQSRSAGGRS